MLLTLYRPGRRVSGLLARQDVYLGTVGSHTDLSHDPDVCKGVLGDDIVLLFFPFLGV